MTIELHTTPTWQVKCEGKPALLSGYLAEYLLDWLYSVGYHEAVKVTFAKDVGYVRGTYYPSSNRIVLDTRNPRALAHEVFHLAYANDKAKVTKWLRSNGYKFPKTHKEFRAILGEKYDLYVKLYAGWGVPLPELPALLREECLAKQFEQVAAYTRPS